MFHIDADDEGVTSWLTKKKRNSLITEEDWWTVWFGLVILLVATVLGIMTFSGTISVKKVPKLLHCSCLAWPPDCGNAIRRPV